MGRIPAAHRCVTCDSIVPEALAVVVDRVSGILIIVSVFGFDNRLLYRMFLLWEGFPLYTDVLRATPSCWRLWLLWLTG